MQMLSTMQHFGYWSFEKFEKPKVTFHKGGITNSHNLNRGVQNFGRQKLS